MSEPFTHPCRDTFCKRETSQSTVTGRQELIMLRRGVGFEGLAAQKFPQCMTYSTQVRDTQKRRDCELRLPLLTDGGRATPNRRSNGL